MNLNTGTMEFALRDPYSYFVTLSALSTDAAMNTEENMTRYEFPNLVRRPTSV
jgi:hypothetical protein